MKITFKEATEILNKCKGSTAFMTSDIASPFSFDVFGEVGNCNYYEELTSIYISVDSLQIRFESSCTDIYVEEDENMISMKFTLNDEYKLGNNNIYLRVQKG